MLGRKSRLRGWLYNLRSSGKILFPQLRDGTGVVQGVALKNAVTPEVWEALKGLGQESALTITAPCAQIRARLEVTKSMW